MDELKLYNVVALTRAISEHNLRRGDIGVLIDIGPNSHYMLEFADRNGVTYAMPIVSIEGLIKVYLHADMVE
ncbi:DUF4926 domain-containing protein [Spirosoma radiotolerans]|uniref:DUF4926 domain-containing protein n=1 Tax=Spirosoma radiotolerans TaxID=1379870 RepID=A0A0E4A271_9BACT|nr:DUF4926 domain-containing protein [Spirosoma radiotolerans]AKD58708.1 hypothetical protein SD10_21520 [Spirosoma radiotolerans]